MIIHKNQANSNKALISTGILSGNEPIPTALLTPRPLSSPQIFANNLSDTGLQTCVYLLLIFAYQNYP